MPLEEISPGFLELVRWAHAIIERARTEAICTPLELSEALDSLVLRGVLVDGWKDGKKVRGFSPQADFQTFRDRMSDITEPEMIALCSFISTAGIRAGIFPPWPIPDEMVSALRS